MKLLTFLLLVSSITMSVSSEFVWGAATAAYQIEGAIGVDGGGYNIWDDFSRIPGKIHNGQTAQVADGSYYLYEKDISLLKAMNMSAYRFSISWPRIFPNGDGNVNQAGIDHYNKLIDAIIAAGLEPFVTLYHWDLPSTLHNEYSGWMNPQIINDFAEYADICFASFGDRVKHWITLNEPLTFTVEGYASGVFAPGRCSDRTKCKGGNSAIEPYIVTHNVLNAHALAVDIYRSNYQHHQKGKIGITLNCEWGEPYSDSKKDIEAAQRWVDFSLGWFADPITFGRYPESMMERVGERLPAFTEKQRHLLKGSWDFFAINHYATWYIQDVKVDHPHGYSDDMGLKKTATAANGQLIGPQAASPWLHVYPAGIYKLLKWIHHRYDDPKIFVTENGCDVPGESEMTLAEAVNDTFRVNYFSSYLSAVRQAIQEGVDVRGYFAWSLLDNFEWADGYSMRFGLHYVDYDDPQLTRTPKLSAKWYGEFATANPHFGRDNSEGDSKRSSHNLYQSASEGETQRGSGWKAILDEVIVNSNGAIFYGGAGIGL